MIKKELREVLDTIDNILAKEDAVSHQLWDVLTALRGPDSANYDDKKNVTIPIRRAAFPITASTVFNDIADFGEENVAYKEIDVTGAPASWHFAHHGNNAAFVLGIKDETH